MTEKLTDSLPTMWNRKAIPPVFKGTKVIHVLKRKLVHRSVTAIETSVDFNITV